MITSKKRFLTNYTFLKIRFNYRNRSTLRTQARSCHRCHINCDGGILSRYYRFCRHHHTPLNGSSGSRPLVLFLLFVLKRGHFSYSFRPYRPHGASSAEIPIGVITAPCRAPFLLINEGGSKSLPMVNHPDISRGLQHTELKTKQGRIRIADDGVK